MQGIKCGFGTGLCLFEEGEYPNNNNYYFHYYYYFYYSYYFYHFYYSFYSFNYSCDSDH